MGVFLASTLGATHLPIGVAGCTDPSCNQEKMRISRVVLMDKENNEFVKDVEDVCLAPTSSSIHDTLL
jgi:hypothetical protein